MSLIGEDIRQFLPKGAQGGLPPIEEFADELLAEEERNKLPPIEEFADELLAEEAREIARSDREGNNAPIDLSGMPQDPTNVGRAARNAYAQYLKQQGEMDQMDAGVLSYDIGKAQTAPLHEIMTMPGLTPGEQTLAVSARGAESLGDAEGAKRSWDALREKQTGIQSAGDKLVREGESRYNPYEQPDSEFWKWFLNSVESSGMTVASGLLSGASWALGGPVAGGIAGLLSKLKEARIEAGGAYAEGKRRGMAPEQLRDVAEKTQDYNLALLLATDPLGGLATFGLDKGLAKLAQRITGNGMLSRLGRFATKEVVPYVAEGATEYPEGFMQEVITQNTLGDPVDLRKAHEAGVMEGTGALLYTAAGRGTRGMIDMARRGSSAGKNIDDAGETPSPIQTPPKKDISQAKNFDEIQDILESTENESFPAESVPDAQNNGPVVLKGDSIPTTVIGGDTAPKAGEPVVNVSPVMSGTPIKVDGTVVDDGSAAPAAPVGQKQTRSPGGILASLMSGKTDAAPVVVAPEPAIPVVAPQPQPGNEDAAEIVKNAADVMAKAQGNESAPVVRPEAPVVEPASDVPKPGKDGVVRYRENGELKEAPVRYEIVEADTLKTSRSEGYPKELQPRDTDKAISDYRVGTMAADLKPELLGFDDFPDRGAPTTVHDDIVGAGNHRTWAVDRAYDAQTEGAAKYREYLAGPVAQELGDDPERIRGMKKPILRRRLLDDSVNLRAFAEDANASVVGDLGASEQAKMDSDKISDAMLNTFDVDEGGEINRDFVESFAKNIVRETEMGRFLDKDGRLSQDGIRRIRNALVTRAYGDPALVGRISESTDDNMKRVSNGMMQAAPIVARMEGRIAKGILHPLSIRQDLMDAVTLVHTARSEGKNIEEYLTEQTGLFDGQGHSDETKALARFLYGTKASSKAVREFLTRYAQNVERLGAPNEQALPGTEADVPTKRDLVSRLLGVQTEGQRESAGLFDNVDKNPVKRPDKQAVEKIKEEIKGKTKKQVGEQYGADVVKGGLDATANAIAEKSANDLAADLAEEPKRDQMQGPVSPVVSGIGENRADAPAKIPFGKMTGKMLADEEAAIRDAKVGELMSAGESRGRAEAEATVYARAARVAATKRRMSPLEWEESRGARVRKGAAGDKASFNQPIDASVNPDERVPVLDISGAMGTAETATNKDILDYLRSLINRGTMIPKDASAFVNIPLKRDGQRHIVASSWNPKTEEGRRTRKTALLSLPELVQNAVFIERKENTDTTEKPNVEEYVRFYIPVKRGESVHTIRLVTEKRKGSDSLAPVEVDLYDVIVEKKESRPPVTPADSAVSTSVVTGPGSASSMTIRRMLAGVKDMDGNEYFPTSDIRHQEDGKESSSRGSITFNGSGKAIISLFESANASTFMHESAHLFLQDVLDAANEKALDELGVADFRALDAWLGGFKRDKDGKLKASTKQHERFARGFERYLRDGKEPSPSLKSAFERFKEWLRKVYQKATDLGVRMTPEVRSIYDSFLTTKEERSAKAAPQETGEQEDIKISSQKIEEQKEADLPPQTKKKPELVGYEWRSMKGEKYSSHEYGLIPARVSDWGRYEISEGSGREIVHVYWIRGEDGKVAPYGKQTAAKVLGLDGARLAKKVDRFIEEQQKAKAIKDSDIARWNRIFEGAKATTVKDANREYRMRNIEAAKSLSREGKDVLEGTAVYEKDGKMVTMTKNPALAEELGFSIVRDNDEMTAQPVIVAEEKAAAKGDADVSYRLAKNTDAEYMQAVERGDMETAQRMVDEAAEAAGFVVQNVHHGTKRIDRIGNRMDPNRATSGPMPFFTDDPDIAENYSKGKNDNSLEIPDSFDAWFKVKIGRGKPKNISDAWYYMTTEQKEKINSLLPHVVNVDENGDETDGFRVDKERYGVASGEHWKTAIEENRGNTLKAAVDIWLNSGTIYNSEEGFIEILRLGGVENVAFESPWKEAPGVVDAHLMIRNPFDTSKINEDVFNALVAASKRKRASQKSGVDQWDKRALSGKQWITQLESDMRDGTTYAWTSVPDWVTKVLIDRGYDGIKDAGGKYTGNSHTVWIPFFPWQVKRSAPVTYDDSGDVIPLSKRFDARKEDIRYQFIGPNAQTSDRLALSKAQKMAKQKAAPEEIRQKTGWFRGMDGKWRFEIDDSKARWIGGEGEDRYSGRLGDLIDHPDLFRAYPDMADVEAHISIGQEKGSSGKYTEYENREAEDLFDIQEMIEVNARNVNDALDTLIHEIQHAVQARENFARGGSSSQSTWASPRFREVLLAEAKKKFVADKPATYAEFWGSEETPEGKAAYAKYLKAWRSDSGKESRWAAIQKGMPNEVYARLAGEIEARDTASRRGLTNEHRKAIDPDLRSDAVIVWGGKEMEYSLVETNTAAGMRDSEHPVTLEGLRRSVPGAKIADLGDGKYRLDLHNGESITVSTVGEIEMDPDVVRRDYGREPEVGEVVAGASRTIDGRRFIELAEGIAGEGTLDHELFETARNMVLTSEEKGILDREIGSTEEQAEAYREFQANRKGAMTGRIVRAFQKIKDFFGAIRARLFGKKSLDVFREIAQGKVWERKTEVKNNIQTQYSLTQKPSGAPQEWEPVAKGLDRVVAPERRKLSFIERLQAARHWWQTEMMDDISPIRDYFGKDIYIKTTNAIHGINSRAQALIEFGDKAKGVKSLFDIFGTIPQNEHEGLMHYAVYKHLIDIAGSSEGAERLATPLARLAKEATDKAKELETTLPKDEFHHRDLLDSAKAYRELARDYEEQVKGLTQQIKVTKAKEAQYRAAISRMDQLYPSWAGAQRDLVKYSQHLLGKLRSAGIVSDELYFLLTQKYPNYIPLQRDFGTEEGVASFVKTRGLVNLASPIKRLKGSKRDVLDPLLQIISNTYVVESLVGKQNAARDIAEMADRAELLGLVEPTTDRHHGPDEYVFHVWENGKKKFYTTTPDIYAALVMSSGSPKDNVLTKILSAPVKALRAGVTHGVGFILRNPIRDTINAGVVGEHFTPVIDSLKGMFHVWKQDAVFEEFMKSGAMQGLAYMSEKSRKDMATKIRMGRGEKRLIKEMKHPIAALWKALGSAAELTELGTRVGQYQKMRDRGESMERSAFVSRDLINYLRGGRTSKMITKFNPFFNAQLQGVAKGLRSFYHDGKIDTGTIARAMLYITLPSMLTCFWNLGGDEDRRKKYLSIPAWQRNLFWNIVVGKGEDAWVIKIPKPFDLGVVFGSIPERFVDRLYAEDKRAFDGIGTSLFNALSPEVAPLFMGLPFELNANYSMFYERSIVPQSQMQLYPKLQYGAYTSEWAKWAGEKFNLSPRKLEYAVLQLTGNLGKETSNLADMAFRAVTEETRPAREWYQQTPAVSAFAVPAKSMKRWEQTFQDEREELNTLYKSAKQIYENSGSKALTVQERRILGAENGVKQVNQLFTNKGGINDLRREISKITVAKNMSAEEKRARVDRLEKRIGELSERGLAYIDRIKKSMNHRGG